MAVEITKWICITIVALAVLFCFMVLIIGGRNDGKK